MDKHLGITEPPLDDLLDRVDNKYQLVIFASKRARQINDYYADLHDGAIYDNVGPLVEAGPDDKPLSISLREINEEKLVMKEGPAPLLNEGESLDELTLSFEDDFDLQVESDEEPTNPTAEHSEDNA